jgi:hypothetical protein
MYIAALALSTHHAAPTDTASSAAIISSQAGRWGRAPLAKARRRVRAISRSVSTS